MHPWPEPLNARQRERAKSLAHLVADVRRAESIDAPLEELAVGFYVPLAEWVAQHVEDRTIVVGLNGAQGTGKSTLARILARLLGEFGVRSAVLSLDDLYLRAEQRYELAERVHPLLATRGVPGTHDVALGERVLRTLRESGPGTKFSLPRFDKSRDDRAPGESWPVWEGRCDVVLFEGWCVGARAQRRQELDEPINELERMEDLAGTWRWYVNQHLGGDYQSLFADLDLLMMLRPPDFDRVFEWRELQESKLRGGDSDRVMSPREVRRFVMHFERLTRYMWTEMPDRADALIDLGADHLVTDVRLAETM